MLSKVLLHLIWVSKGDVPEQQDAAYLEVAERIADEYGTTLRGLVVHADETAPHAHAVWDCRNNEGVPMSRVMKGSQLQDIAADVIRKDQRAKDGRS
jgi:hypothetical protein